MHKAEAIELLERLREQIHSLSANLAVEDDFWIWHTEVVNALENIFGPDSSEKKEFQKIQFELNAEMRRQARASLIHFIEEKFGVRLAETLEAPQDHYYLKRLTEASEFLFALIVILQHRS